MASTVLCLVAIFEVCFVWAAGVSLANSGFSILLIFYSKLFRAGFLSLSAQLRAVAKGLLGAFLQQLIHSAIDMLGLTFASHQSL